MAITVSDLIATGKSRTPTPDTLYDPRGYTHRRRSSIHKRPAPPTPPASSSPSIEIPGAAANSTLPSQNESRRLSRPPDLSVSPDVQGGSSGSEIETPTQVLSESIQSRLQFQLSPGLPKGDTYFPESPVEPNKGGTPLPPLHSRDSAATVTPQNDASYVRSTWRYSKAGLSLGHYATAPAEPGIPASRFANAREPKSRRDASNESSMSGSRSPSDSMAFSPAQAYLSSFSRGTSMQSLDEVAGETPKEVIKGYAIGKAVGYGGFSSVREARQLDTGRKVAVKVLPARAIKTSPSAARVRTVSTPPAYEALSFPELDCFPAENSDSPLDHEVKIWSRLAQHPHILPLLDLHTTLEASYIFMPFCSGGNLLQYIQEYARRGRRRREQSPSGHAPQRASSLRRIISPSEDPLDPSGGGFDLGHARHIFAQIVDGLRYLHIEAEVTHKDIKLENILLDDAGYFRIADFGLAVSRTSIEHPRAHSMMEPNQDLSSSWNGFPASERSGDAGYFGMVTMDSPQIGAQLSRAGSTKKTASNLSTKSSLASLQVDANVPLAPHDSISADRSAPAGSLAYAAPELLSSSTSLYSTGSPAVDVWALGCVLYALLEGRLPFVDEFEPRLRIKILEARWPVPTVLTVKHPHPGFSLDGDSSEQTDAVLEVLRGCLEPDPLRRWTIEQVKDCLWLSMRWPSSPGGQADGRVSAGTSSERRRSRSKVSQSDERSKGSRSGSRGRSSGRQGSSERAAPY